MLGFPCNQFGKQEPGTALEIKKFCTDNYSVTFPLHAKIEVNGDGAHPLYKKLKKESGGSDKIRWNFEKFLLDGDGKVTYTELVPEIAQEPDYDSALASI